jgi:hypothetical protein
LAAIAIFRGSCHVLDYANDEFRRAVDIQEVTPLDEALPGEVFRPIRAVMAEVYRTGLPLVVEMPVGDLWVIPVDDAVALHLARPQQHPAPRPAEPAQSVSVG